MITKPGKQKLETDLASLRQELIRTLDERRQAAAEGDLRENSAYIFLTERAEVLRSQIDTIEDELKNSKVMPSPTQTDFIVFGHQVRVCFEVDNREMIIILVGKNDARLHTGWISCESPLGQALLGKKVGDKVDVNGQPVSVLDIAVAEI